MTSSKCALLDCRAVTNETTHPTDNTSPVHSTSKSRRRLKREQIAKTTCIEIQKTDNLQEKMQNLCIHTQPTKMNGRSQWHARTYLMYESRRYTDYISDTLSQMLKAQMTPTPRSVSKNAFQRYLFGSRHVHPRGSPHVTPVYTGTAMERTLLDFKDKNQKPSAVTACSVCRLYFIVPEQVANLISTLANSYAMKYSGYDAKKDTTDPFTNVVPLSPHAEESYERLIMNFHPQCYEDWILTHPHEAYYHHSDGVNWDFFKNSANEDDHIHNNYHYKQDQRRLNQRVWKH